MKRPISAPYLLVAVAVAFGALGACGKRNEYQPPPPPPVSVAHPIRGPVTDYLLGTGSIAAYQTVDLVARVEGFLRSVEFKDGSIVKAGQLLFIIEPEPYQAKLASYQAQLANAQSEYERQLRLIKENATSQANVEKWRSQRDQAQASVTLARINLGYTRITAPFAGRVGRHLVDPGNLVGATGSSTKLATIEQIEPVYLYFSVNERDVLRIRAAQLKAGADVAVVPRVPVYVGLQTEAGYPHEGTLDFAGTGLDTGSGTLQARAVVPNPDLMLLPGLFARLRIPLGEPSEQLLVPDKVVSNDQAGSYVMVVGEDHKVHQQRVEIGPAQEGMRVIRTGLDTASEVVVDGLQNAVPGNAVTPSSVTLSFTPAPR